MHKTLFSIENTNHIIYIYIKLQIVIYNNVGNKIYNTNLN